MNVIIDYFSTIPSSHRTIILMVGFLIFWILEGVIPIRRLLYNKYRHSLTNLFFTTTTLIINLAFAWLIIKTSDWCQENQFGLILLFELPLWAKIISGLLLLDLIGAYFIHYIEHKVYWMWKFHIIHHSDTQLDTTSALRHHPGESIFRAIFTLLAVLASGAPIGIILLYQSTSAFLSQFNHSNMNVPQPLDRVLSYFLVTPRMHRVHHHYKQPYTDSNYGNIFSIWDRMFGTFRYLPENEIVYGLDVYQDDEHNVIRLLKVPVDKVNYRRN